MRRLSRVHRAPQPRGCEPAEISGWKPVPCLALKDPAQLYAKRAHGGHGTLNVELTTSPKTIAVSGSPLGALPFTAKNLDAPADSPATLIGPTLHVRAGDRIHVKFVNAIGKGREDKPRPTNIHYRYVDGLGGPRSSSPARCPAPRATTRTSRLRSPPSRGGGDTTRRGVTRRARDATPRCRRKVAMTS